MLKCLVVDDDQPIRSALREILESVYMDVDEADSGEDALKLLKNNNYDLILCDQVMPGIGGNEVCAVARNLGIHCAIVTGNVEQVDIEYQVFIKPFDRKEILSFVNNTFVRDNKKVDKKTRYKVLQTLLKITMNELSKKD